MLSRRGFYIIVLGGFFLIASCGANKEDSHVAYVSRSNFSQHLDLNLPSNKRIYFDMPIELEEAVKLLEENGASIKQIKVLHSPITKPRIVRQTSDEVYIVRFPEISLDNGNIVVNLYVKDDQVVHAKVDVGFANP